MNSEPNLDPRRLEFRIYKLPLSSDYPVGGTALRSYI
jgi:hypothetical protein